MKGSAKQIAQLQEFRSAPRPEKGSSDVQRLWKRGSTTDLVDSGHLRVASGPMRNCIMHIEFDGTPEFVPAADEFLMLTEGSEVWASETVSSVSNVLTLLSELGRTHIAA